MRPVTDLAKLSEAVNGRLIRLRRLYAEATSADEVRRSELLAVGVLELDNLVISGLRVLMISSLRAARRRNGGRVSTLRPFGAEGEIGAFALSVVSQVSYQNLNSPLSVPRRNEPTIRDPRDTAKVLAAAQASNLPAFQNALSLNSTLFTDLGTVRNFYAHRNEDTWRKTRTKAQALGLFSVRHANEVVTAYLPSRPVSLFEDWADDAELFFDEATK